MNPYLNYIIEANSGLILFFLFHALLLKTETDFKAKRMFMLLAIFTSLLFPLFHFENSSGEILSIDKIVPIYWLPELLIGPGRNMEATPWSAKMWSYLKIIYGIGVLLSFILFIIRLSKLLYLIKNANIYAYGNLRIAESNENKPAFSFFSFVFLGQAKLLSEKERIHIIKHESIHAQRLHSFDILLVNIIGIFFWFNPLIHSYRKIFIQLHEFEADARAVKNHAVDDYCNLLARVALMSADIKLVNYFNHSLTVKRIEMMRTIKSKIHLWKIAAVSAVVPLFFFVVSCQDHVMTELSNSTLSQAAEVPPNVKADMAVLQKQYPGETLTYLEGEDVIIHGKGLAEWQQSDVANKIILKTYNFEDKRTTGVIALLKDAYGQESALAVDDVFLVVEESAAPVGGMTKFYEFVAANLVYPLEARNQGIEGKVFIEFTVLEDGKLTDFKVMKGLHPSVDAEALHMLQKAPAWIPGKNKGIAVKQRMVLPVSFRLS